MEPISTFNNILARVSLYIDGHIVFVPMEKQRNSMSQKEVYNYNALKGHVLGVRNRTSVSACFSWINCGLISWKEIVKRSLSSLSFSLTCRR